VVLFFRRRDLSVFLCGLDRSRFEVVRSSSNLHSMRGHQCGHYGHVVTVASSCSRPVDSTRAQTYFLIQTFGSWSVPYDLTATSSISDMTGAAIHGRDKWGHVAGNAPDSLPALVPRHVTSRREGLEAST